MATKDLLSTGSFPGSCVRGVTSQPTMARVVCWGREKRGLHAAWTWRRKRLRNTHVVKISVPWLYPPPPFPTFPIPIISIYPWLFIQGVRFMDVFLTMRTSRLVTRGLVCVVVYDDWLFAFSIREPRYLSSHSYSLTNMHLIGHSIHICICMHSHLYNTQAHSPWPIPVVIQTALNSSSVQPSQIGKSHVWFSPRLCFLVFIVHHPFSIILFCSFLVGWMASTWCLVTWSRDWIFLNASRYVAHYQGRREICPPVLETPLLWFPPQSPSLLYLLVFIFSSSFEQAVGTDSGKPSKKVVITDCGQL